MKHFVKILGLCALVSCAKEAPEEIFKLENVVFSVSTDAVKSSLNDHAVVWTSGADQIAIFDNVGGLVSTPFTVTDNKVDAQVRSGATAFYGLYPYDAAATISGSVIGTTLPTVQEATAGSFAPGANLALAYTTTDAMSLSFKNVGALVEFTLNDADVKSITLMGNNNEKIAGKVSIDYNGGAPSVTASEVSVTLQHADGSALASGTTYYFIVAPVTFTRGITFTLTKTDGTFATRVTSASVSFERNQFVKLGTMESLSYGNDLYAAYTAGASVEVAGVVYNKTKDGDATALNATSAATTLKASIHQKNGIFFLSQADEAYFDIPSVTEITGNVVLISRYVDKPVTIKPTMCTKLISGSLIMKNLLIDMVNLDGTGTNDGYMFNNSNATSNFTAWHMEDCEFVNIVKPVLYANVATYGFVSVIVNNCGFELKNTSNLQVFNFYKSSTLHVYKELAFTNNVVYNATPALTQIFAYDQSITQAGSPWECEMTVENNIFYNCPGSNGYFKFWELKSLSMSNNVFCASETADVASYGFILYSENQSQSALNIGNNIAYGLVDGKNWQYAHSNSKVKPDANTLSKLAENPFTSFNTTTGAYVLKDAYKAYGPQNN